MSYINIVFDYFLINHLLYYLLKIKVDSMQAILEDLKKADIISTTQIYQLQTTIKTKYPTHSKEERARIFAKNVHQVIDHILSPFSPPHQQDIKKNLLMEVIKKEEFCISVYDVCKTCIDLKLAQGETLNTFTTWLNHHYSGKLTPYEVASLSDSIISPSVTEEPLSKDVPYVPVKSLRFSHWFYGLIFMLLISSTSLIGYHFFLSQEIILPLIQLETSSLETIELPLSVTVLEKANHLQKHLQYKEVNKNALQAWLQDRNSLLSEDPYFNQIIATAKDFNINPLLLFAITGQEQGFVPKHHTNALEIASNPFNVYGSWKTYNTSIEDSSRIAARTIINLSKGCPEDADPILWLNQNYAEDPNWYKGVTALLNQLEKVALLEP